VPIASIETERIVLGKILGLDDFDIQSRFINMCDVECFFVPIHKDIWVLMNKLMIQGRMTCPATVFSEISIDENVLADILINKFDSNETLKFNIKTLLNYSARRFYSESGRSIEELANVGGVDCSDTILEVIDSIDKRAKALKITKQRDSKTLLSSIVHNMKEGGSKELRVVEYGVPLFDKYYKHERGHTHTIGAQPSVGKTAMALTIMRGVLHAGGTVFISVKESDAEEIMCKMICQESNVAYSKMRYDQSELTQPEFDRIQRAIEYIYSMQERIYIFGGKDWEHSTESIEAQLEAIEQRGVQLDLVVTDYVQNLKVPLRIQSRPRYQQVEWMVEKMADLHKRFDVAGVLLSQLNRSIDGVPHLHNLKEASKIEEESSMITFLHRDKETQPVNNQLPTMVYSEKNRNGELWGMRDGFVMNIPSTHFSTKLHKYEPKYAPSVQV